MNLRYGLSLPLLLSGIIAVLGDEHHIKSVDDFIDFSNTVNSLTSNYTGTTVYLDTDIDFNGKLLDTIGNATKNYIQCTFDGQGHIISNFTISSSLQYVGFFGRSLGMTIKNVVIGDTSSISSSFSSNEAYVAGILGYCHAYYDKCIIENVVNMGNVSFNGNAGSGSTLFLGGIAGWLKTSVYNYEMYVKNCANYGTVSHPGTTGWSSIGGIVGLSSCDWSTVPRIQNCLNYGTIAFSGTSKTQLVLGGIDGNVTLTTIENCLSGGVITVTGSSPESNTKVGSVTGSTGYRASVSNNFWTSDAGYNIASGSNSEQITDNSKALNMLNIYSGSYAWSGWLLNKNNESVTFITSSNTKGFSLNSQFILLPSLANEGNLLYLWYTDSAFKTLFTETVVDSATELYGAHGEKSFTITFDTKGGTPVDPVTEPFGSEVTLRDDLTKGGCSVAFWVNEIGDKMTTTFTVPARDVTLTAIWMCTHITSVEDFIDFSSIINDGTSNYTGTTVYLDIDVDFNGKSLDIIGKDTDNFLQGTFDGQGHIISNLTIRSSLQYVGLFGSTKKSVIKNVVLDGTYSVESSYSSGDAYVGGILGYCSTVYGNCILENTVNMGNVSFSGTIGSYSIHLGGIAGYFYSYRHGSTVKNCANYGTVTQLGISNYSYIGGIVGLTKGFTDRYIYIQNSLNYGTIAFSGTSKTQLVLGGIDGNLTYTTIENCVSAGVITVTGSYPESNSNVGSVTGSTGYSTSETNCFWTSDAGYNVGSGSNAGQITDNSKALNMLNIYSGSYAWSGWLLNKNNESVTFTVNNTKGFSLNSQFILLPSLANEGNLLYLWYTDSAFTTPFSKTVVDSATNLYGVHEERSFTVTFDTRDGTHVDPITAPYLSVVTLRDDLTRNGCTFLYWKNEIDDKVSLTFTVPSRDVTLTAVWMCTHITFVGDFIDFTSNVNSGTTYSGTTVYLDTDIDFNDKSSIIIGNYARFFQGTFDGQGHIISNFIISTSSNCVGLFGYSEGLTIKNVVIDATCSIESSYNSGNVYIGGIIGYCEAESGNCNIENTVNMGNVSFSGTISEYSLHIGGIIGYFYTLNRESTVKNCANYGTVTHSGTSKTSFIGGITGYFMSYSLSQKIYIQNCLNHGAIVHSGSTTEELSIGGIGGEIYSTVVENCVSAGIITNSIQKSNAGSIAGYIYKQTYINNTFWTSDVGYNNAYGYAYDNPTIDDVTSLITDNSKVLVLLNIYSGSYAWNGWILNKNNESVTFTTNNTKGFSLNSQIILLPSLANEGNLLYGWYTDDAFTTPFSKTVVDSATELYGTHDERSFTITFDTRDGTHVDPITAPYLSEVTLPTSATRNNCTFLYWKDEIGKEVSLTFTVPARDVTLTAMWMCTRITSVEDFIDFSDNVNNGITYSGTTVYLDTDIDLSGKSLDIIGKDASKYFLGTFDGQGHIISSLTLDTPSSQYVGLFGYSEGLTIKNVVMDSTCSIGSSYSSGNAYLGGIVGHCYAKSDNCNIENTVNMGNVSFSGIISEYNLYLGGIAGYLHSYNRESTVKNCANYGTVIHNGTSKTSIVGGIIGTSNGTSSVRMAYIQNCLNYGAIIHDGSSASGFRLGGISGEAFYAIFENCISAGAITSISESGSNTYIGSIVGKSNLTDITSCFWTSDVGHDKSHGSGNPAIDDVTSLITDNSKALNKLNIYSGKYAWSGWLLNKNNEPVTFTANKTKGFSLNSQFILLPSLANEGNLLYLWYTDSAFTTLFTETEIEYPAELYGTHGEKNFTVTFDTKGGTPVDPITAPFGSYVTLPTNTIKSGFEVLFWLNEYGDELSFGFTIPSRDVTLTAVWIRTHISSPDEFIDFAANVNSGTTYSGMTVCLDNDIDFDGKSLDIIGKDTSKYFQGTFDGQDHIISNLTIRSSLQYVGLFGYSDGLTIKNVVIGGTCSISSSLSESNDVHVGGFIGYCYAKSGNCNIENTVNMGNVLFSGSNSRYSSRIGGIAGYFYSPQGCDYDSIIRNCANYGSVTNSGSSSHFYIGGILGHAHCYPYFKAFSIQNCLNYGAIAFNGSITTQYSNGPYIGGIVGETEGVSEQFINIENCVSAGVITNSKPDSYVGGIIGSVLSNTNINNSFWTSDVGYRKGYHGQTLPNVDDMTSQVIINYEILGILNDYSDKNSLNNWAVLHMNGCSINNISQNYLVINNKYFPDAEKEGYKFNGWFNDPDFNEKYDPTTIKDIVINAYAKITVSVYTITFDTKGETSFEPITEPFNSLVILPTSTTRTDCTFLWVNEYGEIVPFEFTVPARDVTLTAAWMCTHITSVDGFIEFSNNVNIGVTYEGLTVYLDTDVDLSGKSFNIIGNDTKKYFQGTFDGQGHIISNLFLYTSSSQYVGIFGCSEGLTIKNVVIDSTCSISSYYSSGNSYVGGIVGYCDTKYDNCNIENTVNMGNVSLRGTTGSYSLYLGGIAGYLYSTDYESTVKNCANYGTVTHTGISKTSFIGGITGFSSCSILNTIFSYIQNCLNYGTIVHDGSSASGFRLGGISGYTYYNYVENCVSAGIITSSGPSDRIGAIIGYAGHYRVTTKYCFWTSDVGYNKAYGYSLGNPTIDDVTSLITDNTEVLEKLNIYSGTHSWNGWLLNKNNESVTFTANKTKGFSLDYQFILLPSLANEGNLLYLWYTDSAFTTLFTETEIEYPAELYGTHGEKNFTVTFDTKGGTPVDPIAAPYLYEVTLPSDIIKDGCRFMFWKNAIDEKVSLVFTVPARNVTLTAVWMCTHITSDDDFIDFSNNVNSGLTYSGVTVYVDNDIDFDGKSLDIIGKDASKYFLGTFDGQGHIISNLTLDTPSSLYVGLFGYSEGLTIKNVVIDDTYSVESSYNSGNAYIGGVIGYCYAKYDNCNIENTVNMGNVSFSGTISEYNLYLGGIAGYFYILNYESTVKNCANYGTVTHTGTSRYSFIGGITGTSYKDFSSVRWVYIQNCLNHGAIIHSGSSVIELRIGGISGGTYYTIVENCVSAGIIINSRQKSYVGSIVGFIDKHTYINNSFWTSDVGHDKSHGSGSPTVDDVTSLITDNSRVLVLLNIYSGNYAWSGWLLNKNNESVTFTTNNTKGFSLDSQIILLPSLANEGNLLYGWYTDDACTTPFTETEIEYPTELYGAHDERSFTITFDTSGGTPVNPITAPYLSEVTLPTNTINDKYTFLYWKDEIGKEVSLTFTVPARDVTLTAMWMFTRITSVEDFIDFSDNVNNGITYSGLTVYLDTDIDLSGKSLDIIGKDTNIFFQGTFDGQGHIISNLNMSSSLQYVGLFGYSEGLTIKNVVMDSTCSIGSSYSSGNTYLGGIFGHYYAYYGNCNIENTMNMGNVSFSGNISEYNLYLGGIAGYLHSYKHESTVKNCANYGTVIHNGTSKTSIIGGIIGTSGRDSSSVNRVYIQNCLNYGAIIHDGSSASGFRLGGISGEAFYAIFENCVSAGAITSISESGSNTYIGSVVGYITGKGICPTGITSCFWTSDVGHDKSHGSGSPTIDDVTSQITDNTGVLERLNIYSGTHAWSGWLLNKNNEPVTFTANKTKGFSLDYQFILLPSLANEGNLLYLWYTDSAFTTPFSKTVVDSATNLYGAHGEKSFTVTFDTKGGTPVDPITAPFGSYVTLPTNTIKSGCEILYWEDETRKEASLTFTVPSRDVTLTAVWIRTHISSPDDFNDFSNIVYSEIIYSGVTVYLDNDIDFNGKSLDVIGNDARYFQGTFDGQGHIISNLNIGSSLQYVGLFSYSDGLTIKNVVIDDTSSIESSYSSGHAYAGGIIGYCVAKNGNCNIENTVNMGYVSFSGSVSSYKLYLGGIAGYLHSYNHVSIIRNCANYGSVTQSSTSSYSYIGGIIGSSRSYSLSQKVYIQNCINYGAIIHNKTLSSLWAGGICGKNFYSYVENCVSAGIITSISGSRSDTYIGSIVGDVGLHVELNYCFWTNDVGYKLCGNPRNSPNTDNVTSLITDNSKVLNLLNIYSSNYAWSGWLLNKNNEPVTFTANNTEGFSLDSQIILLPSLANEENLLYLWYTDSDFTTPFTETEIEYPTELYGTHGEKNFTVTFDTSGGTPVDPIAAPFGSRVTLPSNLTKNGCMLVWINEFGEKMSTTFTIPARNVTLTAVWISVHISSPDEFIDFAANVNSGTTYSGVTVYVDNDIDFGEVSLSVIGNNNTHFQGTFDGQGHIISNLTIRSSLQYVGLFGSSDGLTIKNVVIDDTSSIESSYKSGSAWHTWHAYVGGIIGYCVAESGNCNIENTVNMGLVSFSGSVSIHNLYLGGIAGYFYSSSGCNYDSIIRNCANYGSVTHSGISQKSYIGGIIGDSSDSSKNNKMYIQNCLNYGTITNIRTASNQPYIGGILGTSSYTKIENCVSAGVIMNDGPRDYVGSIIGNAYSSVSLKYCFWTVDVGYLKSKGVKSVNPRIELKTMQITDESDILNKLNYYSSTNTWNGWILNKDNAFVTFTTNNTEGFSLDSQFILLPSLSGIGNLLFGWYTDDDFTTPFTETEIYSTTELYGIYEEKNFTITFDTSGGTPVDPITSLYLSEVILPTNTIRNNYIFVFWKNEYGEEVSFNFTVPARNVTLTAVWLRTRITVASEFIDFSNKVSSGTTYAGATVYLDADIDLSEKSGVIGGMTSRNFQGTFDGQGYVISNLKISSSLKYVGLFGYSKGLTLKNVIMDESCSITSLCESGDAYIGGILGYCIAESGNCNIENTVNMGNVSFSGTISRYSSCIGGIIGYSSSSSNYETTVKNCANYGGIAHPGASMESFIGGIVGKIVGSSLPGNKMFIQNCLNCGAVPHKENTKNFVVGGIAGASAYASVINCVSTSDISSSTITSRDNDKKGIVGEIMSETDVSSCYYTSELDENPSLITDINSYSSSNKMSKWLLNPNSSSVAFKVNNGKELSLSAQVILLPDPTEDYSLEFSGWYTDPYCATPLSIVSIDEGATLYGLYGLILTVSFNSSGGINEINSKNVTYKNSYGELPTPTKESYVFIGWFTEDEKKVEENMKVSIKNNHTLYAHWVKDNFAITFIFNNGNEPEIKIFKYGANVVFPEDPKREGFVFDGWNDTITIMPAQNITIAAKWYSQAITISFGTKSIDDEVKQHISKILEKENTIIEFVDSEGDSVICIIRFVDNVEKGVVESFVETIIGEEFKSTIGYVEINGKEWSKKDDDDDNNNNGNGNSSNNSDNSTIILLVVVVAVVVVVVLVVVLGIFLIRRNHTKGNTKNRSGSINRVVDNKLKAVDANKFKSNLKNPKIYPKDYVPPVSIADALIKAGLDEDSANEAELKCNDVADISIENGFVIGNFTPDDAAAICLYTFDFGDDRYESNPYRLLNKALRAEDNKDVKIMEVRDVLYLVMHALRKLPVVSGITLYRGIREKVDVSMYEEGSIIVWPGFSSTSPDMNATKAFLDGCVNYEVPDESKSDSEEDLIELEETSERDNNERSSSGSGGTLFIIEDGWGYNVQPYSYYPDEEEILLEPEREFKVMSVTDSDAFLLITLKMRKTKTLFEEVFGKEKTDE